jgi:hypothetical protein
VGTQVLGSPLGEAQVVFDEQDPHLAMVP